MRIMAVLAASLALVGCSMFDRSAPARPGEATVVRVVDGDTVVLDIGGDEESTRLIGIDTPESVKPNSPVECYGPEAADNLERLLPAGSAVRVERDAEIRDQYGRLLLYVYRLENDRFVNHAQAAEGFARLLVIAPNDAHAAQIRQAVHDAERRGLGLWSACPGDGRPP